MKAVAAGALPAERFKFFYKTVEFLPNALAAQIASGVYRVIELSPAWLFGQFGQRSMWQDVRKKLERAEAREIRAKGGTVAPHSPAAAQAPKPSSPNPEPNPNPNPIPTPNPNPSPQTYAHPQAWP